MVDLKTKITKDVKEQVIADYLSNEKVTEIAEKYKLHTTTIHRLLKRNNIPARYKCLQEDNINIIRENYEEGESTRHLAKKFNVSPGKIQRILRELKILRKRGGSKEKFNLEEKEKMKNLYKARKSVYKIADIMCTTVATVLKALKSQNVKMKKGCEINLVSTTHRKCSFCTIVKLLKDFPKSNSATLGHSYVCHDCAKVLYYTYVYGASPEDAKILLKKAQEGRCEICKARETRINKNKIQRLSLDHNHVTGKIRGLLCNACNFGIGLFKESSKIIDDAYKYTMKMDTIENRPLFNYTNPYITPTIITKNKHATLKYIFNITINQFEYLKLIQNNTCAICKNPPRITKYRYNLSIDHDHSIIGPLSIRGLLCTCCNLGISKFKESPIILKSALTYLAMYS